MSTYRIQLHSGCTFQQLKSHVAYLHELGVGAVYASPFLTAAPGSIHGYDIVDPASINPEIGTLDDLRALRTELRRYDLGLVADVVPNHMSNSPLLNRWWKDVLENGPSSHYAAYFDIDWQPLKPDLANKVLLPVLGDQFGNVLEAGQLVVRFDGGAFKLHYFERQFPLAPRSYAALLAPRLEELLTTLGESHPDSLELLSILTAIRNLPDRTETDAERLAERRREKEVIKRRLHELTIHSAAINKFIADNLRDVNGVVGHPASFDRLDQLLQDQAYRLADWRVAADEINYRRFFDINELAAICTENPHVLEETHQLLFNLLDEGVLCGLRIDHPDGLYDPRGYLAKLQERQFRRECREWLEQRWYGDAEQTIERRQLVEQHACARYQADLQARRSDALRPLFVVVEKILAPDEMLPDHWPVEGTVGYEFLHTVNGLFVDSAAERSLTNFYERLVGSPMDFADIAYQCKRLIVKMSLASELQMLGHRLDRISEGNRNTRDFTLNSLTRALQEIASCFEVYRTYIEPQSVQKRDVAYIDRAVDAAMQHNRAMSRSTFDFIRKVLRLEFGKLDDAEQQKAIQRFVGRFQQLTGPVMAKAVEDTAFYRYNRLASLNEVGGHPAQFGVSVADFHAQQLRRSPRWSYSLNTTSTHDTKRSEDVRARIAVLSEVPRVWQDLVRRWMRRHRRNKTRVDGRFAPSVNSEYLLYQTLVGIWPQEAPDQDAMDSLLERVQTYMLKVAREAKVHTSWISPHAEYEAALLRFVASLLDANSNRKTLQELHAFARQVAAHGCWNSLSQLLIKIAAPGVPDLYQGTELWDDSLVDPDNRRSVDFARAAELFRTTKDQMTAILKRSGANGRPDVIRNWLSFDASENPAVEPLEDEFLAKLVADRAEGRIKQFATCLALRTRREHPELFTSGDYVPLAVRGAQAAHVVAFARQEGDQAAIIIAPRLTVAVCGFGGPPPIGDCWKDASIELPESLAAKPLYNVYTRKPLPLQGRSLAIAAALHNFPIALYITKPHDSTLSGAYALAVGQASSLSPPSDSPPPDSLLPPPLNSP
ncbi:MAG: malto-oligosyltrehalose synthase [Pirellulales bacterium]